MGVCRCRPNSTPDCTPRPDVALRSKLYCPAFTIRCCPASYSGFILELVEGMGINLKSRQSFSDPKACGSMSRRCSS